MFGLLISSLTVNAVNPGRIVSDILDNEKPSSMKVFPSPNRFLIELMLSLILILPTSSLKDQKLSFHFLPKSLIMYLPIFF